MTSWDSTTPTPQNQDSGSEWQPPANGWADSAVPPQTDNQPAPEDDGDWFDPDAEPEKRSGWVLTTKEGKPLRNSIENAAYALECLPYRFSHNLFSERDLCNGIVINDRKVMSLHAEIERRMHMSPTKDALYGAIGIVCDQRKFHPVKEYLNGLEWDQKLRLNRCGTTYFGTADTPLQNAICRLIVTGMTARIMKPGCQFDYMPILQGEKQGEGKSTALRILAGDWFVEGLPLDVYDLTKVLLERSDNAWVIECADLGGWRGSDIEKVKGMISTREDKSRMSYGRLPLHKKRQFIIAGTANPRDILRDNRNRRFPIIEVENPINLDGLRRDRDQLFAEAMTDLAQHYAPEYHITLPEALWDEAEKHSQQFRQISEFEAWAKVYFNTVKTTRITNDSLKRNGPENSHARDRSRVMQNLGYRRGTVRDELGTPTDGWIKKE